MMYISVCIGLLVCKTGVENPQNESTGESNVMSCKTYVIFMSLLPFKRFFSSQHKNIPYLSSWNMHLCYGFLFVRFSFKDYC